MHENKFDLILVGERLREIRKSINRTLKQMAHVSGLSTSTIHEMEKGVNKPNTGYLHLLAREFNVNLNWLVTGDGAPFLPELDLMFDFGKDRGKILEMIYLIENSDKVRYELLLLYSQYREENKDFIDNFFSEDPPPEK